MFSFYLLFLLCIAGLAASAPTTHHRHHLVDSLGPFPYGKLADKLLKVNDVSYYTIDDLDEDIVRVYPENDSIPFSFSTLLPIASFEPKLLLPLPIKKITIPNDVSTNLKNLWVFSFAYYRIPDIIKKVVTQKWDTTTALIWWRTMTRTRD